MRTSIVMLVLSAACGGNAMAQSGYPYQTNPSAAANEWNALRDTWDALTLWYEGVSNRCMIVGTNLVALPQWVETWQVPGGTTSTVVPYVMADGTPTQYVNVSPVTIPVTTTNCLGPFAYPGGTAYPTVSVAMWDALEGKTEELMPHFVSTNGADGDGSFHTWLTNSSDYALPMESKAGLFSRTGLGVVASVTTNALGWITGGDAAWTRESGSGGSVVIGRAVGDHTITLGGFPDAQCNGQYRWYRPSETYHTPAWIRYGQDNYPRVEFSTLYNRWIARSVVNRYELPRDGRYLPVSTGGEWVVSGGSNVIAGAVSSVSTGWVCHVDGEALTSLYGNGVASEFVLGDALPWIHYTRADSNAAAASLTVVVSGVATNASRDFGHYWEPDSTQQEAAAVSSAWTPLTVGWGALTNVAVTGPAVLGDCVEILYTNLALGGPSTRRLLSRMIDEQIAALKPLKWTVKTDYDGVGWYVPTPPATNYWRTGEGAEVGWTEAKAEAATNWTPQAGYTPTHHSAPNRPGNPGLIQRAGGVYGGSGVYFADAERSMLGVCVSNLWTGAARTADLYLWLSAAVNPDGNSAFFAADPDLASLEPNRYQRAYVWGDTSAPDMVSPVWGTVAAPVSGDPMWPSIPPTNGLYYQRGYEVIHRHIVVIKWEPPW